MNKFCSYLDEEREGFAISFEIMMTMFMVALVVSVTVYFAQVFQLERYFADVTSSTCAMASRYGGNESKAYKIQVKKGSIEDNANLQLQYINNTNPGVALQAVDGGKFISVSDYPDSANNVEVKLSYKLGQIGWGAVANIVSPDNAVVQTFKLPSLMQTGRLIR